MVWDHLFGLPFLTLSGTLTCTNYHAWNRSVKEPESLKRRTNVTI